MTKSNLRDIPAVDTLLRSERGVDLAAQFGKQLTISAIRSLLDDVREEVMNGKGIPSDSEIINNAETRIKSWIQPSLAPVINATGTILHTNLGRAPLSAETIQAMQQVSESYNNLEFDLNKGKRGKRSVHAEDLLKRLLNVESALVVNNNAAAVMLVLSALANRKKVIIPHSQLVEIGGGFRVPDVMRQSGAKLVAIGTTNRTHLKDYETALNEGAKLVLNAHHSNFKIVGFTTEPSYKEIADVAHKYTSPFVYDQGSGALLDTAQFGLTHEPTLFELIEAGADIICFSGDKLLGGPQAGIIVGKANLLAKIKRHPFARAVRADKTCLAGVAATLTHYLKEEAIDKIPIWQMIAKSEDLIHRQAESWKNKLHAGEITKGFSMIGGGSLPGETLTTHLLSIHPKSADKMLKKLRELPIPIIARIEKDQVLFDPRTVLPAQEELFLSELSQLINQSI